MARRTMEGKASGTAAFTCFTRACATREKVEALRGPDHLAEVFLSPLARGFLKIGFLRTYVTRIVTPPGIYPYVSARTKLMDELFVGALESGFARIVILGAGFDTRALRFRDRNRGTKIFELDSQATQRAKREILNRKRIALPSELVFVPIDFNRQSLSEVLPDAGCQAGRKSFFLWEGVTMYLDSDAVDRTLAFIRDSGGPGSRVTFDYIYASVLRRENKYYGEKAIFERVAKAGEPWTFGIEEGGIDRFLSERGFEVVSHRTASDLETAYLVADDGARLGRVNGTHAIVTADARTPG